jgi:hypothetical protein
LGRRLAVTSFSVEVLCPEHGLERFRVRIFKRMNIASDEIAPKVRMKPRAGEISCLYIGRNVSYQEAKNYLVGYFRDNIQGEIVRIKMSF